MKFNGNNCRGVIAAIRRVVQNINVTLEQWNKEICGGLITYDRSCLEGGKKHELTFETVE